jgi:LysM repeat protein
MDIYMTEIGTGSRLALSMLPEKARHKGSTSFQRYDIINIGNVEIPKGTSLLTFSWSATLPGKSRRNASYVKSQHWRNPSEIINLWEKWRKEGTKIRLMITETAINYDVFLDDYMAEATGGNGDYEYSINYIESKPVEVYTVNELNIKKPSKPSTATRPPAPKPAARTYTVKKGDSLWRIAEKKLQKGSRWPEIFNLNKGKIKNPNLIYPGWVLTLPN